jgi:hypothetical protein
MDTPKNTEPAASRICECFAISDAARKLLLNNLPSLGFLEVLIEHRKNHDAVRFLAHLLPKREAVWWACQCARQIAGATPPEAIEAAVKAGETWIGEMTEDARRAAFPAANHAGLGTAAGSAAMAAFLSGGSLTPADSSPVPPGEYMTAQLAAGSVITAAVADDPKKMQENFYTFLRQGVELYKTTNQRVVAPETGPDTRKKIPTPSFRSLKK